MILNKNLRAQLSEATRTLMSGGAVAATAAIQKALNGIPSSSDAATPSMPSMPDFMRDMNFTSGSVPDANVAMPDFVSDLLARLGVSAVPDGEIAGENLWEPQSRILPVEEVESKAKSGGQFVAKSFTNHAGTRKYKVYIPTSYHGQAMPLMVMLHGCTQNPDDFARGTRMNALAEEKQCFVVYPAQTQQANSSKCWNWFKGIDQQRGQGEPSIIAGITREVISDYKLDAGKVYVAGLSAGGAMAIIMGTTYPELYAAVGVHSGLPYGSAQDLPSAYAAMKGSAPGAHPQNKRPSDGRLQSIPIIVFHGDRDKTVHASNGEQLMAQNVPGVIDDKHESSNRIKPDVIVQEGKVLYGHRYTRTSHHDGDGRAFAEHWVIHGAGHAWAGGSQNGSFTDAKGPDAAREMMRFFYTQSHASMPEQKSAV